MIYAVKLKMRSGCRYSNNLLEIDEIYLEGCKDPGYYKKAVIHDFLKSNPGAVKVKIWPYPDLIPATSPYSEKYVKSTPDSYRDDDLLDLPRE